MRILLVDDHPLFMDGLKDLLTANDIEVTGTATNIRDAVLKARATRPDVILMDVQMPGGDGIEAARLVKAEFPEIRIVMLTVSQNDKHLFEAIKAGASGYLLKGLPKEQFLALLTGLSQGESPLSPGLAAKVLTEFARLHQERDLADRAADKTSLLSSQQVEILKLVAQGLTYKKIGGIVYLSEATVKYHMGEIMNRLHLENRSQVIAFAAELGLAAKRKK
ncbi:MAG TPA: response regulator transcription factor [Methylomusa anaerophila]|uniref:Response regulator protein VraR n=1 Tax=Methylomusa anaerophila TaxID=1930071 RepID=A0A348AH24_9FIRM|nr:response regulator transcription factor [Methylomusa anaerophila]BBB90372.1 response regulator protein VraR [Methylomusa anaerophila]HML89281.1 response regulator transcription factor [Methylomusa anaerophila]